VDLTPEAHAEEIRKEEMSTFVETKKVWTCLRFGTLVFGIAAFSLLHVADVKGLERTIRIVRESQDDSGTYGHIEVDGKEVSKTLERNDKLIPEGTFSGIMRYSSDKMHVIDQFGRGKTGDFLLEIAGKPGGHTNVQVHMGNIASIDSTGCILVGTKRGKVTVHKVTGEGLLNSMKALQALRIAFYGTPNPKICPTVNIVFRIEKAKAFVSTVAVKDAKLAPPTGLSAVVLH
jgi:hypothetical protein